MCIRDRFRACDSKSPQRSFLNDELRVCAISGLSVMFQIGVHHFVRYVPCAPATESDRPEMAAPISLFQLRELLLQLPGTAPFQFFDQVAHAQRERPGQKIEGPQFPEAAAGVRGAEKEILGP